MNFLNPDSKVMTFLNKVTDYLILTLLWILCSIPIFTIGASTTAMFYASFKLLDDQPYISRCFFRSFKENFKLSTLLWLFAVVLLVFFVIDIQFYKALESNMRYVGIIAFSLLLVLFIMTMMYLFPYVSKFHCNFKQAIKISLLLSIRHLPTTILLVVLDAAIIYGCLYYAVLFMFLPGILCFANSLLLRRVFKKYIPKEDEPEDDDSFMTIEEIEARDAELAAMAAAEEAASAEDVIANEAEVIAAEEVAATEETATDDE